MDKSVAHACNLPPGDIPVLVPYRFRQLSGGFINDLDLADKMGLSEFVGIELPTRTGRGSDGLVKGIALHRFLPCSAFPSRPSS